jgi:MoaD family protein
MLIEVLYFADLKDIAGKNKEFIDLEICTIKELAKKLLLKYPQFKDLIWDEKYQNLKQKISLAINDNINQQNNRLSIELVEGDKVAFLLPLSGG